MELTTGQPAAFCLRGGGHAVGIATGNFDEVGTPDETTGIVDVVIFDDFGDAQQRYPGYDVLLSSLDTTEDGAYMVGQYVDLQIRRAADRAEETSREADAAVADLLRWRARQEACWSEQCDRRNA